MSSWTDEQIDEPRTMRDRLVVSDQLLRRTLATPPQPMKPSTWAARARFEYLDRDEYGACGGVASAQEIDCT